MSVGGIRHTARFFLFYNRRTIIRVGIVLGALCAAILIGRLVARGTIDIGMLLAVILAPTALVVALRLGRFEYGILAVALAGGMLNFFSLSTGTESRIVMSLIVSAALVGAWLVHSLVVKKRVALRPSPVNKPVLLFAAVNVAAYAWSILLRDPTVFVWRSFSIVQLAALAVNILLPVLAMLVGHLIRDVKWLKWLTWLMIGMGAFVVASLLLGLPTYALWTRGASGLFATWVTALALALALFEKRLAWWVRALLLLLVAAWIFRNFVQARIWLSGWLPLLVACLVICTQHSRKLLAAVALTAIVFVGANFDSLYQEVVVANRDEGGEQRLGIWATNLGHVANHPILGMGPAGYAVYNMTYNPKDARSTHNNYFDILAQTGVIGFGVFIWLLASFVRVGIQTRRSLTGRRNFQEAFAVATLAGTIAAIVAMMLGDWVIPFAYNSTISGFDHAAFTWLFLGGMVSLSHMVKPQSLERNANPTA